MSERKPPLEQTLALRDQNIADDGGKRNVADAGLALWRLESQPGLGLFETFTHPDHFVVEVNVAPAQPENFPAPQTSEQRDQRRRAEVVAFEQGGELHDLLRGEDRHLLRHDLGRALSGADVPQHKSMSHGFVQGFGEDPVGVPDGASADTAFPIWATVAALRAPRQQRGVPALDVGGGELLDELGADEGRDLVLDQSVVAKYLPARLSSVPAQQPEKGKASASGQ